LAPNVDRITKILKRGFKTKTKKNLYVKKGQKPDRTDESEKVCVDQN